MLPKVHRVRHCAPCARSTDQALTPARAGTSWKCTLCDTATPGYTLAEMRDMLRGAPPKRVGQKLTYDPTKVKIYLHHPDGELELSLPFVRKHLEITNSLPKVGEPVFTRADDLGDGAGLGLEIPYGSVTRVEVLP